MTSLFSRPADVPGIRAVGRLAPCVALGMLAAGCRLGYEPVATEMSSGAPAESSASGANAGSGPAPSGSGGRAGEGGAASDGGTTASGIGGSGAPDSGALDPRAADAGSGGVSAAGEGGAAGSLGGNGGSGGTGGSGGSGGTGGMACVPTNGGVEVCDGIDNDCAGGADDTATCAMDCHGVSFRGHGYLFCATAVPWPVAWAHCNLEGMLLASVDDPDENQFFAGEALDPGAPSVWIGATDLLVDSTWEWDGGNTFWNGTAEGTLVDGFWETWAVGHPTGAPNNNCAELVTDLTWLSAPCTDSKPYVCEGSWAESLPQPEAGAD